MAVIHRTDPRALRLVLILLTVALAVATALAVYFAATRGSTVTTEPGSNPAPSIEQDAPCWRPNVPC